MGSVSTVPGFLAAFRSALAALPGLSGVNIFTAPVDEVSMGKASIVLGAAPITATYDYHTMGRVETYEEYEIDGFIWANVPGAGEEQIAAARTAAYGYLEQVHDYVATLTDKATVQAAVGVDHVLVSGHELEQFAGDGERHAYLRFRLKVDAYFTPA